MNKSGSSQKSGCLYSFLDIIRLIGAIIVLLIKGESFEYKEDKKDDETEI